MSKKTFAAVPKPAALSPEQEAFIAKGRGKDVPTGKPEPTTRVSIDLPRSMHKRFKIACEMADTKMAAELMAFIERRTAELERTRKP